MEDSYTKYLHKKLYLIESTSRKYYLKTKDNAFKEIMELCNKSPEAIEALLKKGIS